MGLVSSAPDEPESLMLITLLARGVRMCAHVHSESTASVLTAYGFNPTRLGDDGVSAFRVPRVQMKHLTNPTRVCRVSLRFDYSNWLVVIHITSLCAL